MFNTWRLRESVDGRSTSELHARQQICIGDIPAHLTLVAHIYLTKMLHKLRSVLRTKVKVRMSSTGSQSGQTTPSPATRGPVSWATLGLVATGAAASVAYYQIAKQRKKETAGQGKVDSYGTPLLGGPWSMVDGQGRPVTSGSFPGQYTLLYFGFTFCPDICPNELVKMSKVVDAMGM